MLSARLVMVLLSPVIVSPDRVSAEPMIEWEVANRFRLFKEETQFRAIAAIFKSIPESERLGGPALALETELERRAAHKELGPAFGDPTSVARYGWASAVVRNTCFQAGNRGHSPCLLATGDQFVRPQRYDAIMRLKDMPSAELRTCTWNVSGREKQLLPCDKEVRFSGLRFEDQFTASVAEAGTQIAVVEAQRARTVTILGFGDSFASGEGNPDRPVVLGERFDSFERSSRLPGSSGAWAKVRQYPMRPDATPTSLGPASAAIWLNTQCHRSLYSHQLKASLQLAIEEPHATVTFLGYACTGAEVYEGMLDFWEARSDVARRYYDAAPQLIRFFRDVCADPEPYRIFRRPKGFDWRQDIRACADMSIPKPDALLLSIGGNDVGFSNVIANEVVNSGDAFEGFRKVLYRLWRKEGSPIPFLTAEQRARDHLPERYAALADTFDQHIGIEPRRVIQTLYPQLTKTSPDDRCQASTSGMTVHEILGMRKPSTGSEAAAFVETFNGLIEEAVARLGARAWVVVGKHVPLFTGHAICSSGAPDGSPDSSIAGTLAFPEWNFERRRWEPASPSMWPPYRPKQRWFVTPNDAFLAGNYMNTTTGTSNPRDRVQPLFAATLSGAFHPNALGQAAMADAVLIELRRALQSNSNH
jgi:hypothetical protein